MWLRKESTVKFTVFLPSIVEMGARQISESGSFQTGEILVNSDEFGWIVRLEFTWILVNSALCHQERDRFPFTKIQVNSVPVKNDPEGSRRFFQPTICTKMRHACNTVGRDDLLSAEQQHALDLFEFFLWVTCIYFFTYQLIFPMQSSLDYSALTTWMRMASHPFFCFQSPVIHLIRLARSL